MLISARITIALSSAAFVAACASAGTRPHDMTAAGHESAAAEAEAEGHRHESKYDPGARAPMFPRGPGPTISCPGYSGVDCFPLWTSVMNPTEQHLADARQYRALAAKHRAASAALREAEARACDGVAAYDRDVSPFYHREEIVRVEAIQKERLGRKRIAGARVVFRPLSGMTEAWLQRVVDCHLARWTAIGSVDPQAQFCPLTLRGVRAEVKSIGGDLAVDLSASDASAAEAALARAKALIAPH